MSEKNNDTIYTAKDIEQYFAGTLTPEARHALEKAALDDPFLADAMEGYQQVPVEQWKSQLVALKEQMQTGNIPAKVIPMRKGSFRFMRVAAAAVIILGGLTTTWMLTRDKKDEPTKGQIAQNIPVLKEDQSVIAVDSVASTFNQTSGNVTKAANERTNSQPGNTAPKDLPTQLSDDLAKSKTVQQVQSPPVIADEKKLATQTVVPATNPSVLADVQTAPAGTGRKDADVTNEFAKEVAPQKKSEITAAEQNINRSQALNRVFKAQVVGPDNTPLPFSNVNVKSENFGTYADVKGNFRLVAADSLLTVEIKSVGYQSSTYTLNSNQPMNKIVLNEEGFAATQNQGQNRKSKVMNNAGAAVPKIRKPTLVRDSATNAEPADGWDNYNTYIANNMEIPDELLKSGKHGEINITFDVKPDGKVANVITDQENCSNCKILAQQLVEQGPQWRLKKGKPSKATIKVQY